MAIGKTDPIPIPDSVVREAARWFAEMRDPEYGLSHEEVWKRIDRRNPASVGEDDTELKL